MTDTLRDRLQASLGTAYSLERELGGGGMSRVFVAHDSALGRKVVVKVLPAETVGAVSLERFKREIQLAARLQHPHIIPVLTAGEADGIPYYTMPYVSDETLRTRLDRGNLSLAEAVRMMREVARALAFAHRDGVVHRDIKPENVLLSGGVAAVTDFGVAKAVSDATTNADGSYAGTLTSAGIALGTPVYISPEQASGESHIDNRADIYSFGCVAYELLTGAPPFVGRPAAKLMAAHVMEEPAPIGSRRADLPRPLADIVMRCLAKRPEDRPATADEIIAVLDGLSTPSEGRAAVTGAAATQPRRPGMRWLGAAAAVSITVLAVWAVRQFRPSAATAADASGRSIAVLPFTNLGANKENEYFSEGITEEITNALTKVPGLSVASQSVVAAASAGKSDVRQVGRSLKVYAVLSGSVQHDGDKVRISAQLVNTETGRIVWTDRYDDQLKDVFVVQDKIARAIVSGLQLKLIGGTTTLVRSQTESPEAYTLYLQGLYFWNRRTASTIHKAIDFFNQAIARDSGYARAYAGLALSYAVLTDYADVDGRSSLDKAIQVARHALVFDSTLAEAWTAIGFAAAKGWHPALADSAFRHAITLDSTYATSHHWYAFLLAHLGQFDSAVVEIKKARDLEPLSLIINSNVGRILILAGRDDEAQAALQHSLELDPGFGPVHEQLAVLYMNRHQYDRAIAEVKTRIDETADPPTRELAIQGYIYAVSGHTAEARAVRDTILARSRREPISHAGLALLDWTLGEHEKALAELEQGVTDVDATLWLYGRSTMFAGIRADPRGGALLRGTEQR